MSTSHTFRETLKPKFIYVFLPLPVAQIITNHCETSCSVQSEIKNEEFLRNGTGKIESFHHYVTEKSISLESGCADVAV